MQINEVSKRTKLTKKAIEYYTNQGLIAPAVLENGYRDYTKQDVERLIKIGVLRKLEVSTEEIRAILSNQTNVALHAVAVRKELDHQRKKIKKELLRELSLGQDYLEINKQLQVIEQEATITEKLLEAFPGYYGQFLALHFSRFLNQPVQSQEQQSAYETILSFLDEIPSLEIPADLEDYLAEATKQIGTAQINRMLEETKESIENPEQFLADNQQVLERYLEYRQSDEYKASPAGRLMELMKEFSRGNGYYDIFIPAMKRLSTAYSDYYQQMEIANQKLLSQYPAIENLW